MRTGTGSPPSLVSLLSWSVGYLEGVVLEVRNRKSSSSSQPSDLVQGYLEGVVLEDQNRKSSSSSQPTDLVHGLPEGLGS